MINRFARAMAAFAFLAVLPILAQDDKKLANLTGSWKLGLQGDHVIPMGLVLEQEGTKLKGTLSLMGNDVPVEGEFTGGVLTLGANAKVEMRGPGGDAEHGTGGMLSPTKLKIDGKMNEDGTMAGNFAGPRGSIPWTAERFKERKVPAAQKPKPAPVNLSGAWSATATTPQGPMKIALALKHDGNKVGGTMTSDHSGELPVEGMFANGTLLLVAVTNGGGPGSMRLECSATIKDDGTIAGELASPMGKMALTAERAK